MKKLFTLFATFSIAAASFAQTAALVMEKDTSICSGEAGLVFTCDNHVTNNTGAAATFKWTRYETSMPGGWQTTICDKNNCYTATTASKNFNMDANETAIVKVNFMPNGAMGDGVVRINVSSLDGNYSTDSYFFGSAGAVGVPQVQEVKDLLLYPMPARENLYVVFNPTMKPTRVDVHNILGQKVKTVPVQLDQNTFRTELQLADLDKGLYFVRVYQSGTSAVITKQFTKE